MGYRSDVTALFYTEEESEWPTFRIFMENNIPRMLKDNFSLIDSKNIWGYMFKMEGVKWDAFYVGAQEFNKFRETFLRISDVEDNDSPPWVYEFARVGDFDEDIEQENCGGMQYYLGISRSITVDF